MKHLSLLALALSLSSCIIYQPYPVNQPSPVNQPTVSTPRAQPMDFTPAPVLSEDVSEREIRELIAEIDSDARQRQYEMANSGVSVTVFRSNATSTPKQSNKPKISSQKQLLKSTESCGNLPSKCTQMTSCSQARRALQCGNTRLDRDGDGIPCESICS